VQKRLVLLGGGHAHLTVLANLRRYINAGFDVAVVQPARFHYYSGMGPGMLGSTYEPGQIRFDTRKQVERNGGRFIEDAAVAIDPVKCSVTLGNNTSIPYDVLSCNTGSQVPSTVASDQAAVIPAKPIAGLIRARTEITTLLSRNKPVHVGIVGGGPSAVELACNVRQLANRFTSGDLRISLFAGSRILAGKPSRMRRIVSRYLEERDVTLFEGDYAEVAADGTIGIAGKENVACDLVLIATGVTPSPLFREAGLTHGDEEGLAVNEHLQSIAHDNIFGGGDCIDFVSKPLDKVGVYAVRQNPVLCHNLLARLKGEALRSFSPGGSYLLIYNLGCGHGIFMKGPLIFSGALAFTIKDLIDRRFIRKFRM